MQNRDGSWGCFVRGGRISLDRPCPVFTGHALVALRAAAGLDTRHPAVARGLAWLARVQRSDGAVPALWYRGWTAGTAAALDAWASYGRATDPAATRAAGWLLERQHPDGGWGDGEGAPASAEETAWALAALLAAGRPPGDPWASQAAAWLLDRQLPSGGWSPSLVGVYFSSLMYHDDRIATGYSLQALGRYRRRLAEAG